MINVLRTPVGATLLGMFFGMVILEVSPIVLYGLIISIAVVMLRLVNPILCFLFFVALILGVYRYSYISQSESLPREGSLVGSVVSDAQLREYSQSVVIALEGKRHLLMLELEKYPPVLGGDSLRFFARQVETVPGSKFPDYYKNHLRSQNIHYLAKGELISHEKGHSIESLPSNLRSKLSIANKFGLSDSSHRLLDGLLWGKDNFSSKEQLWLQNSGLAHIVAVSGYNVGLVVLLVLALAGRVHKRILLLVSFPILLLYLLVIGADNVSLLRAVVMAGYLLFGLTFGRKGNVLLALLLSSVVLLWINPYLVNNISFQLSFLAVLGILVIYPLLPATTLPQLVSSSLKLSIAAGIATSPVLYINFGGVSMVSFVSNVLVTPLIPFITFSGYLLIPVQFLFPGVIGLLDFPLRIVWEIAHLFGDSAFLTTSLFPLLITALVILIYALQQRGKTNY